MFKFRLSPPRIVLISYLALILVGTLLLMFPFSTTREISFLDVLFTATSSVTVTGLIVLDTRNTHSFGTLGLFFTEYGHKSYKLPFWEKFFNYLFMSVSQEQRALIL